MQSIQSAHHADKIVQSTRSLVQCWLIEEHSHNLFFIFFIGRNSGEKIIGAWSLNQVIAFW